ncbi:myrosinase 1-like isoform X2 [Condylostylus longicornis]|uniref:myrosinase 1-like isoform X2 n=1 Tax=Condylostylus longicornis TaxID=2530218 RepID=UPI00244DAAD3|nr:myrosinase 1-like isoform X2 [Condylostylus longicornis]
MKSHLEIILLSTILLINVQLSSSNERKFPKNFVFGSSSSAYQIEGGWNEDGRGLSIWDVYTHENPNRIADRSNGDIAADSYHKFDEDLKAIKELGLEYYRFSISWPRVMPFGNNSLINEKGIEYYNSIINKLLNANVTPMITMYHFDLPEELNKIEGFLNPSIIEYFKNYSDLLFDKFGDRVKHWVTFNEAFFVCRHGYGTAEFPPTISDSGISDYKCIDNLLKSHAVTYKLYKEKYFKKYDSNGKVGIALNARFFFSETNDTELVNRGLEFELGILAQPIFGQNGGYPEIVLKTIAENDKKEGLEFPRLKQFDSTWLNLIKGSADFLGFQYYSSRMILPISSELTGISFEKDANYNITGNPKWKPGITSQWYSVPEGLELILKWISKKYGDIEIMITENGWADKGELEDDSRVEFLRDHMESILNAIESGVRVTGYLPWSLIDNFEWNAGYTQKFGLYGVDFSDPNRKRTQKKSARYFKEVIKTRKLINQGCNTNCKLYKRSGND